MTDRLFDSGTETRDIYNITRLNREARAILEGSFPQIWVQGEISNLAQPASGHIYFSLKDEHSQVRCAMFRNRRPLLKFKPENGSEVLVRANVSLYEDRGEFQLIIDYMEPAGSGALQRAFEELKQRLFKEGLFNEEHKLPVPHMAKTIGVITSPTGAAIRDILSILRRRFPLARVIVYPTAVQGEGAAEQIIAMLQEAERRKECEVLILARGGGSLEDLWAFNNENLARTIFRCTIPVVSGIGHEIDFTIADFVADHRAATPSAAAEMVSPDQVQIKATLTEHHRKLLRIINVQFNELKQKLWNLEKRIPHPARIIQTIYQRLDSLALRINHLIRSRVSAQSTQLSELTAQLGHYNPVYSLKIYVERCDQIQQRLQQSIIHMLKQFNANLENISRALDTVSPLSTLNRGYAIVTKIENNHIVHNAAQLNKGDRLHARFAKGRAQCTVDKTFKDDK